MASGGDMFDKTVRVWDSESGAEVACLRGHQGGIYSVAFSRTDGGSPRGPGTETVRMWEPESGGDVRLPERARRLRQQRGLLPGRAAAGIGSGSVRDWPDYSVRAWESGSGTEVACLRGHEDEVNSVAFSPDGRRLASGSDDRTVRVWDIESGTEVACLRGHKRSVKGVAFSPDGRRLASRDGRTVRVWDMQTHECLEVIEGLATWRPSPPDRRAIRGGRSRVGWRR